MASLTGHRGERRNRCVGLVTDDFRVYHRLVPFLEAHGLRVLGLRPGEAVPASVQCLIGGPPEDPRTVPLRADPDAVLLSAFCRLDTEAGYRRVTFGLDPGKVIGLAVVADGQWLLVAEAMSVAQAVERIGAWSQALTALRPLEVHVGAGAPKVGHALLAALRAHLPRANCSLVPEEATTPGSHVTGSRHTDAAVHIALRRPLPSDIGP